MALAPRGTGLRGRGVEVEVETCPSGAHGVGAKVEHKRSVCRGAVSLLAFPKHQRPRLGLGVWGSGFGTEACWRSQSIRAGGTHCAQLEAGEPRVLRAPGVDVWQQCAHQRGGLGAKLRVRLWRKAQDLLFVWHPRVQPHQRTRACKTSEPGGPAVWERGAKGEQLLPSNPSASFSPLRPCSPPSRVLAVVRAGTGAEESCLQTLQKLSWGPPRLFTTVVNSDPTLCGKVPLSNTSLSQQ
jgi:hypothetical protein